MRVLAEQNRAFGYAVAASLALHALLLLNLPALRQSAAPLDEPPLVARLVEPAPTAAPSPPPAETLVPPKPPPARRAAPAKPKAKKKPRPDEPVLQAPPSARALPPPPAPAPAQEQPRQEAPAAPAASPPPPAPSAVAISPPAAPAPDRAAVLARFRQDLVAAAVRYKRYPRMALDNGWTGDVLVVMDIDAAGKLSSLRVKTSSGYEILDAQALEMFRKAAPEVAVPPPLRGQRFSVELRAIYSLRDRPG